MICLDEAMVLLVLSTNPMKNKTELHKLLFDTYHVNVNQAQLSAMIDKLDSAGVVGHMDRLPRTYFVSPDKGQAAMHEFELMVRKYNDLCFVQKLELIQNTDEFKRLAEGQ